MAADPLLTPLLIGLGLDELSMDPKSLPAIKFILRRMRYEECVRLAAEALEAESPARVRALLRAFLEHRVPEWLLPE